jgi:hypothetical protein
MFDLTLPGESVMNHKQRGSEKIQFQYDNTGVRSLEGFENVEALLAARGGISFGDSISSLPYWWRFGTPAFWTKGLEAPVVSPVNAR